MAIQSRLTSEFSSVIVPLICISHILVAAQAVYCPFPLTLASKAHQNIVDTLSNLVLRQRMKHVCQKGEKTDLNNVFCVTYYPFCCIHVVTFAIIVSMFSLLLINYVL